MVYNGGWSRITYFRPFSPPSPSPPFSYHFWVSGVRCCCPPEIKRETWLGRNERFPPVFCARKRGISGAKKKRAAVTRMKRENEPHHGFTFFPLCTRERNVRRWREPFSFFLLAVVLRVRLLYYDFEGGNLIPLLAILRGAVFTFFLIFRSSTFPR